MNYRPTSPTYLGIAALAVLGMSLGGCIYEVGLPADGDDPMGRAVPIQGMHQQSKFKDQTAQPIYRDDQPQGMRYAPPRTVTVDGFARPQDTSASNYEDAANPVPMSEDNLTYGEYLYTEQCAVCHGSDGAGGGTIVEAGHFPAPPTLNSDNLRRESDQDIYDVITNGQGLMWSYDSKLTEIERWAVVNYIRVLQRANYPQPTDLDQLREM